MQSANSMEKILMLGRFRAGEEGGDKGWDGWMASSLNGHLFEQTLGDGEEQESLAVHGVAEADTIEQLNSNN